MVCYNLIWNHFITTLNCFRAVQIYCTVFQLFADIWLLLLLWHAKCSPRYIHETSKGLFYILYFCKNTECNYICVIVSLYVVNVNLKNIYVYSWNSLCRSGRDPDKYFDIGMVQDNQLGIMWSEYFGKISVLKRMLTGTFKHPFTILPLLILFIGKYKIKR